MEKLTWDDAIKAVLQTIDEPMHYTSIAEEIGRRGLVKSIGKTPSNTVASIISTSLRENKDSSPFVKVSRGYYSLRSTQEALQENAISSSEMPIEELSPGIIRAFGMYWRRDLIKWKSNPKLLGKATIGAAQINFSKQIGVYLLYDGERPIYVGRSVPGSIGQRLYDHTRDRLSGRWSRFSWFGLLEASGSEVNPNLVFNLNKTEPLIKLIEAILIEALEPPLNRKQGDYLTDKEYIQVPDPVFKQDKENLIKNLASAFGSS
jgi:hypothetical protein